LLPTSGEDLLAGAEEALVVAVCPKPSRGPSASPRERRNGSMSSTNLRGYSSPSVVVLAEFTEDVPVLSADAESTEDVLASFADAGSTADALVVSGGTDVLVARSTEDVLVASFADAGSIADVLVVSGDTDILNKRFAFTGSSPDTVADVPLDAGPGGFLVFPMFLRGF